MTTLVLAAGRGHLPLRRMALVRLAAMLALLDRSLAAAPRLLLLLASAPLYAAGRAAFAGVLAGVLVVRWCRGAVALGWLEARERAVARGTDLPTWLAAREAQA